MSLESVRADLAARAPDLAVIVTDASTATVQLAADVHGVAPARLPRPWQSVWATRNSSS